MSNIILTLKGR